MRFQNGHANLQPHQSVSISPRALTSRAPCSCGTSWQPQAKKEQLPMWRSPLRLSQVAFSADRLNYESIYPHVLECKCMCVTLACVLRSGDNSQAIDSLLLLCGLGDQTQIIGLGDKCLYSLNHPTPKPYFILFDVDRASLYSPG